MHRPAGEGALQPLRDLVCLKPLYFPQRNGSRNGSRHGSRHGRQGLLAIANVLLCVQSTGANVCGQLLVPSLYAAPRRRLPNVFKIIELTIDLINMNRSVVYIHPLLLQVLELYDINS